ncbi:MAG: hypothetical protein NT155_00120 [Candidatus Staskawiczbacteria bacterium]|nr:hypothetical protein [Candidatus Staskawiczbacteria bacterium]
MVTIDEEIQAKEFLKRAEIRTMKKDLMALRESDALKERDKITKLKTLEEQLAEKKKAEQTVAEKAALEKASMAEVLTKNEGEERTAEKDLKNYALEQERQQIFLLESQRLAFEKQVDAIDKEKDPALKLEKNKILLQKRDWQAKLDSILEQEKKLEDEQKFITEKEQTTTIASQRKSLEQSRWDLDKKIQDIEKKRWVAEKETQDADAKVAQIDKSSEQLVVEKNELRDKILGADKSLRDIYSVIMAREEEKRRGSAEEQIAKREALAKVRAEQKEKVQRQQWSPSNAPVAPQRNIGQVAIPVPAKRNPVKPKIFDIEAENKQREKFLKDVEEGANKN